MKILRTKIFGAIKRANKAKKKAWEIHQALQDSGFGKETIITENRVVTRNLPDNKALNLFYELGHTKSDLDGMVAYERGKNNLPSRTLKEQLDSRIETKQRLKTHFGHHCVDDEKAKRIAASNASIEKHKDRAKELRDNNKLNIAARDAKRWVKKNPGKSAAIGATVAAAGAGLGYAAYKHNKNKKKDSKSEKN